VGSEVLEALVTFLYTGRAEVEQDLLQQFMAVGEDLGVLGLVKDMEGYNVGDDENITRDVVEQVYVEKASVERAVAQQVKLEPIEIDFIDFKRENSTKLKERRGNLLPTGKKTKGKFRPNAKKMILPQKSQDRTKVPNIRSCQYCGLEQTSRGGRRQHISRKHRQEHRVAKTIAANRPKLASETPLSFAQS
jgi:hypothetical protein